MVRVKVIPALLPLLNMKVSGKPNILNTSLKEKNLCPLDLIFKFSKTVLPTPPKLSNALRLSV